MIFILNNSVRIQNFWKLFIDRTFLFHDQQSNLLLHDTDLCFLYIRFYINISITILCICHQCCLVWSFMVADDHLLEHILPCVCFVHADAVRDSKILEYMRQHIAFSCCCVALKCNWNIQISYEKHLHVPSIHCHFLTDLLQTFTEGGKSIKNLLLLCYCGTFHGNVWIVLHMKPFYIYSIFFL